MQCEQKGCWENAHETTTLTTRHPKQEGTIQPSTWSKTRSEQQALIRPIKVIGKDEVAVPTHLFKVILAQRKGFPSDTLALGAFVVPNCPIGFERALTDFQVNLKDLERKSGLTFFPKVDQSRVPIQNLCKLDSCKLMSSKDFNLYITTRKVSSARNINKLDKAMAELKEAAILPDEYLLKLYEAKKKELTSKEVPNNSNRGHG